jgi:hypothetical protein
VIATMARANQTWGEERIAAELLLKFGVSVSRERSAGTCGGRWRRGRVHPRKHGARLSGTTPARH